MELQLREGQANDSLERLRECLAEKSLRFRKQLRSAKGQKKTTRAWDSIHRMEDQIKQVVVTYRTARDAIRELGRSHKFGEISRDQEVRPKDEW
jgi:archaellum component FlaC